MSGTEIKNWLLHFDITPRSVNHGDENVVQLDFPHDNNIIAIIKQYNGRWSQTLRSWYVPRNKILLEKIIKTIAIIKNIDLENLHLKELIRVLHLKAYSGNTVRNYKNAFSLFLDHFHPRNPEGITKREIEDYCLILLQQKNYSETSIHTIINAIKFYYEQVLKKPRTLYEIQRPKKPLQNPNIFSKEDISAILQNMQNLKHQAILMTCYACGLRVSEVIALKITDIDSGRMVLYIRQAKGKKDRMVSLSQTLLTIIREYYKQYKPREYLFEGDKGGQYSARSVQQILQQAKNKSHIKRPGSVHALRHSFATHLMDKGTDVILIQKLLGHNDIKTTMRYLHVTTQHIANLQSPLDDLNLKLKK